VSFEFRFEGSVRVGRSPMTREGIPESTIWPTRRKQRQARPVGREVWRGDVWRQSTEAILFIYFIIQVILEVQNEKTTIIKK